MVYKWKETFAYKKADVQKVTDELSVLGNNNSPVEIVDFAQKHRRSELHKCFEWDDSIAGYKYRLEQARTMVSSIILIPDEKENEEIEFEIVGCRAFENVKDKNGKQGYMHISAIVQEDDLYDQVISSISKTIFEMKEKIKNYAHLKDSAKIIFYKLEDIETIIREGI